MAIITQKNNTEPLTPSNGSTVIYPDSTTKKLATKNDAGTVTSYASEQEAEQVKVSANDTTKAYLESKIVAGANVTITTLNDGENETISIEATTGGVPDGGTTGQVLKKNSNINGDAGWEDPTLTQQQKYAGFFSGYWYRTGTAQTIALAQSANFFRGGFFRAPEDITIDRLGLEVTTTATADYIIGIYEIDEADPTLGTIVHQTPTQSLVAEAGPQEIVASFTLVRNKLYVLGVISNDTITLRTANTTFALSIGSNIPQDSTSSGENWLAAFTFGVLENDVATGLGIRPPLIWFRKA